MKYNVMGFYQPRAVELGLCSDDLLVLRWFVDYAGTDKMRTLIIDNRIYYWVNYETVLRELPILKVKKQTLYKKHFMNLCNAGVLIHKQVKEGGNFSYYCYGINYKTLLYLQQDDTPLVKNVDLAYKYTEGVCEDNEPCVQTYQTLAYEHTEQRLYNNTKQDNNIKEKEFKEKENNSNANVEVENGSMITAENQIFDFWNECNIIKHRDMTDNIKKTITKALKTYTREDICKYIKRYAIVLEDDKYFFNYKWTLIDFLNRKDGISSFSDEGSKWVNFVNATGYTEREEVEEEVSYEDKESF